MSFWNHLPPEIKQHVVKRLDLMGRLSLRCTSRFHRSLVDSTKHYVPRVRYDLEGKYASITIYHGIDNFYKLFFKQDGKDVRVARQENDYDPNNAKITTVKNKNAIQYSVELLSQLLPNFLIRIGTMEVNIDLEGHLELETSLKKHENALYRVVKADKLIFPKRPMRYGNLFFICLCEEKFETQEYLSCRISSQNQVPVAMYFDKLNSSEKKPICKTDLFLATPTPESLDKAKERLLEHIRQYDSNGYPPELGKVFRVGTYCEVHSISKKGYRAPPPSSQRHVEDGIVMHTRTTKCGKWTNMFQVEHEKKYLEKYKDQKCGLGILCPHCSDPFDYWYHQTLPLRLIHPGESLAFFMSAGVNNEAYNREMDMLTKNLQNLENQKKKKLRKNQKKKGTPFMEENDPFLPPVKEYLMQSANAERLQRRLQKKFTDSRSFLFIVFGFGSILSSFLVYFLYSLIF